MLLASGTAISLAGFPLLVVTAVQRFAEFQTLLRVQDPVAVIWVKIV
jgi:hypothetical protein